MPFRKKNMFKTKAIQVLAQTGNPLPISWNSEESSWSLDKRNYAVFNLLKLLILRTN